MHGKALEAKTTSPSPIAAVNSRARPRRSSSATAYSGVPNSSRELGRVAAADRQAAVSTSEASGYSTA